MIRRPPRSTQSRSSAASDVYKRQLIDPLRRNTDIGSYAVLADPHRLDELFEQNFSRMDRGKPLWHHNLLVVIDDFYVVRVSRPPAKTDPPLPIDANAVLPGAVAVEPLQPVARWNTQVAETLCGVEHTELPQRSSLQLRGQSRNVLAVEEPFGVSAPKAPNHPDSHNGYR